MIQASHKDRYCVSPLVEVLRVVNFTETGKQNGGCQGLGEGGDGELMFKGYGVSVLQEEEVLETCGTAM